MRKPVLLAAVLIAIYALASSDVVDSGDCAGLDNDAYESGITDAANYHVGAQRYLHLLLNGEYKCAEDYYDWILRIQPGHTEALLGRALALAGRRLQESAITSLQRAVESGLPPSFLTVIPEELMAGLRSSPDFLSLLPNSGALLVHGPMLGDVTPNSAQVWLRTDRQAAVTVTVFDPGNPSLVLATGAGTTSAAQDYTVRVPVRGLSPNTEYAYKISLDGSEQPAVWPLRTFPARLGQTVLQIGFGGCADYIPPNERM